MGSHNNGSQADHNGARLRVAVVYHFFAHYRAPIVRELIRNGTHEYHFVAGTAADDPSIKTWNLEQTGRFRFAPWYKLLGPITLQSGLFSLAVGREFDTIIYLGNAYFLSTWLSAVVARARGKRIFFWTHGWIRDEQGVLGLIRNVFYRIPHGLLLYGHNAKSIGIRKHFAPSSLYVIYNSLDYDTQRSLRAQVTDSDITSVRSELFGDVETPVVICTARLTSACRLDLLLQAQQLLRSSGHLVNVLLVGAGPEENRLRSLAAQLGGKVRILGACYDEWHLARMTMAANVTVSPGKVGLTAIHSLAYGTPVITHDNWQAQGPECEAIVSGCTGELFKQGDVHDLARVIQHWTSTPRTPDHVRSACFRIVERFWNPQMQRRAIDRAVSGYPADDLFWMRPSDDER